MLDADVGIDLTIDVDTGSLVFALAEPDPLDILVKSVESPLGADLASVQALLPSVVGSSSRVVTMVTAIERGDCNSMTQTVLALCSRAKIAALFFGRPYSNGVTNTEGRWHPG